MFDVGFDGLLRIPAQASGQERNQRGFIRMTCRRSQRMATRIRLDRSGDFVKGYSPQDSVTENSKTEDESQIRDSIVRLKES